MLVNLAVESYDWLCALDFKKEVSKEGCHDSGLAVPMDGRMIILSWPVEVVKQLNFP